MDTFFAACHFSPQVTKRGNVSFSMTRCLAHSVRATMSVVVHMTRTRLPAAAGPEKRRDGVNKELRKNRPRFARGWELTAR